MEPELYETLEKQTKSLRELTKDDYIFDYSLKSNFKHIETSINESKATTWIDRLSIRNNHNNVCPCVSIQIRSIEHKI